MNKKVLTKLEFDKILAALSEKALSDPGKEAALCLMPQKSIKDVQKLQSETLEAESVLMRQPRTPISSFSDISSEAARLKASADLGCKELLRINSVLKAARRAKTGISKPENGTAFFV